MDSDNEIIESKFQTIDDFRVPDGHTNSGTLKNTLLIELQKNEEALKTDFTLPLNNVARPDTSNYFSEGHHK